MKLYDTHLVFFILLPSAGHTLRLCNIFLYQYIPSSRTMESPDPPVFGFLCVGALTPEFSNHLHSPSQLSISSPVLGADSSQQATAKLESLSSLFFCNRFQSTRRLHPKAPKAPTIVNALAYGSGSGLLQHIFTDLGAVRACLKLLHGRSSTLHHGSRIWRGRGQVRRPRPESNVLAIP